MLLASSLQLALSLKIVVLRPARMSAAVGAAVPHLASGLSGACYVSPSPRFHLLACRAAAAAVTAASPQTYFYITPVSFAVSCYERLVPMKFILRVCQLRLYSPLAFQAPVSCLCRSGMIPFLYAWLICCVCQVEPFCAVVPSERPSPRIAEPDACLPFPCLQTSLWPVDLDDRNIQVRNPIVNAYLVVCLAKTLALS